MNIISKVLKKNDLPEGVFVASSLEIAKQARKWQRIVASLISATGSTRMKAVSEVVGQRLEKAS